MCLPIRDVRARSALVWLAHAATPSLNFRPAAVYTCVRVSLFIFWASAILALWSLFNCTWRAGRGSEMPASNRGFVDTQADHVGWNGELTQGPHCTLNCHMILLNCRHGVRLAIPGAAERRR